MFIYRQNELISNDMRYYPFTDNNPYDSWLTRLRISMLGETSFELSNRLREKAFALREMDVLNTKTIIDSVQSSPNPFRALPPLSGFSTPSIGTIGLGNKWASSSGLLDTSIAASTGYEELVNTLGKVARTPLNLPTTLPEINMESLKSVNPTWSDHVVNKNDLTRYSDAKKGYTFAKAVGSSIKGKEKVLVRFFNFSHKYIRA